MRGRDAPVLLAALVAGLLQTASFWPWSAWWLQLGALALLGALLVHDAGRAFNEPAAQVRGTRRTEWRAGWIGFAFGFGWLTTGVSWLYVSMHRYGGMPAPLAALALVLFTAFMALFYALVAAAVARADRAMRERAVPSSARLVSLALLFAGLWTFAEMARGWLFTGFPWLAIGYAHVDGPLAAFAPLVGVYGVSALAALSAFGLGAALLFAVPPRRAGAPRTRRKPTTARTPDLPVASGATALAAMIAFAFVPQLAGWFLRPIEWTTPHGAPLNVRLLQGNVPQEMKFDPARSVAAMQAYVADARRGDAALTVLPETAWTLPWSRTPSTIREALVGHLARTGGLVAIGMPLHVEASGVGTRRDVPTLANSVAIIDGSGEIVSRYDKRHLVPFGEFVPFGFGWFVDLMEIPLGEFARGAPGQAPLAVAGQRVAFDICFEDLFGEEIAAQVRNGATILANVSNIAWFGDSHALPQHLQISRMRALEVERPMLRATNTGITAAIDARARVLDRMPAHVAGSIDIAVQGRVGLTPYARLGNVLPFALALTLVATAAFPPLRVARRTADRATQTR